MSARIWWLGGGATIMLGLVVVLATRAFAPVPIPASAQSESVVVPSLANAPIATPADPAPAPWLRGQAETPALPAAPAAPGENPERARQLAVLQQSMLGLADVARERSIASQGYLRQALDTLQEMDDPAITSQINLVALRQNLEISIRMQQISDRMRELLSQPPGEQRDQRYAALTAELQQLQGQLRTDLQAAPAATEK